MTLREILDRIGRGQLIKIALAVVIRPWLWPVVLRFAPSDWWRRPQYLPVPAPEYLEFRLDTAYGKDNWSEASSADIIRYFKWCRKAPKVY